MSQLPAQPFEHAQLDKHRPRPASVIVLAILGIVFAVPNFLFRGLVTARHIAQLAEGTAMYYASGDTGAFLIGGIGSIVGFIFSLVLLISCIGALFLKPWARRTLIVWSGLMVVWATIWALADICWLRPNELDALNKLQTGAPINYDMTNVALIAIAVLGWLLSCGLSLCFLVFLERPRVKAAFEGIAPPPAANSAP